MLPKASAEPDRPLDLALLPGAAPVLLKATKEIILSAGTFGSAQILMNSGIGDSTELKAIGVKPLVNLPSVGKNLTDHPLIQIVYSVNSTETFDPCVTFALPRMHSNG